MVGRHTYLVSQPEKNLIFFLSLPKSLAQRLHFSGMHHSFGVNIRKMYCSTFFYKAFNALLFLNVTVKEVTHSLIATFHVIKARLHYETKYGIYKWH